MTDPLIADAAAFAAQAHAGQVRKYTGEPYIKHPKAVARLVREAGGDAAMVAAAWLHDTTEDTAATLGDISERFGLEVADLVDWLSDVSKPEDGDRALRKAKDREHIAAAPARAKAIKLADLIDNTASIVEHDPAFARVYLKEKAALLDVLAGVAPDCGPAAVLLSRAWGAMETAAEQLRGRL